MSEELKPCPFCGSVSLYQSGNGVGKEFIECRDCGASGPASDHTADADEYWNRRTNVQESIPVAYASSSEFRRNQLLSKAQYDSCAPKNRTEFDIPLYTGTKP